MALTLECRLLLEEREPFNVDRKSVPCDGKVTIKLRLSDKKTSSRPILNEKETHPIKCRVEDAAWGKKVTGEIT
ncbi:hypothetical protein J6590_064347 [Homalodisca vitripennis]|nr:hypothetical protein J6590_064347 [Homalodisca vitripennis]